MGAIKKSVKWLYRAMVKLGWTQIEGIVFFFSLPFLAVKKLFGLFGLELKFHKKQSEVAFIREMTTNLLEEVPIFVLVNEHVGFRLTGLGFVPQAKDKPDGVRGINVSLDKMQPIVFQTIDTGSLPDDYDKGIPGFMGMFDGDDDE